MAHHVGAKFALLRRFFCPRQKKASSARALGLPFRQKPEDFSRRPQVRFPLPQCRKYFLMGILYVGASDTTLAPIFCKKQCTRDLLPLCKKARLRRLPWKWVLPPINTRDFPTSGKKTAVKPFLLRKGVQPVSETGNGLLGGIIWEFIQTGYAPRCARRPAGRAFRRRAAARFVHRRTALIAKGKSGGC